MDVNLRKFEVTVKMPNGEVATVEPYLVDESEIIDVFTSREKNGNGISITINIPENFLTNAGIGLIGSVVTEALQKEINIRNKVKNEPNRNF